MPGRTTPLGALNFHISSRQQQTVLAIPTLSGSLLRRLFNGYLGAITVRSRLMGRCSLNASKLVDEGHLSLVVALCIKRLGSGRHETIRIPSPRFPPDVPSRKSLKAAFSERYSSYSRMFLLRQWHGIRNAFVPFVRIESCDSVRKVGSNDHAVRMGTPHWRTGVAAAFIHVIIVGLPKRFAPSLSPAAGGLSL
ncbi:hypothetical protein CC85DRAFT_38028 [Cutaneotrichosporon oleaginosum]|uniref:Uncharacterized protein n=1 Tax=Cutaneotrichosporon oleaginosum TaxID=879819 RepID=A0A0J1ASM0_9TREE|nr:uncharacterized protein CC85DRAFT_38028 [Cutaneotrichosporon oleaginosum]KLT38334.1 hypothetical protein CC85DRAFT_38028 [Cutaneotrichosporon oleaginosum]TXT11505.1 hypothetical protein COLE_01915 [Cutaneotrichosporon oleaginosum]